MGNIWEIYGKYIGNYGDFNGKYMMYDRYPLVMSK